MAEKDINDMITAAKRKRGANWSAEEEIVLIEEVNMSYGATVGASAANSNLIK